MKNIFENKVVWITGASSGIGKELAIQLSKKKCILVLSARREKELICIANELKLTGNNVLILPFDLADVSSFSDKVERVISTFNKIDFLINNGGFSQRAEALDTAEAVEREIFEVNYFAHTALSKLVIPHMIKNGSGHITVISSIAGKFGFYLRSSYSAAKHALHGYFESLRLETEKKGIRILLVCPGKINTDISVAAKTASGTPHNRMDLSHELGMSANTCAKKIILSIEKNKQEIFVGGKELLVIYLKRFFPFFFNKIIRKQSPY